MKVAVTDDNPRGCRALETAEWASIGPASRIVRLNPVTLRRWADLGRVPYRRVHGWRLFWVPALENLARQRERSG